MKDSLPFQARWTVKVLQWMLSREVSLEEMLQDEDVLAGVVTYLTKKVKVEEEVPGHKENVEKVTAMEKELDFVRCRLSGADQQRKNEVLDLENRNSELREEVVKLTHKIRAIEKEKLDAQFSSSGTKAQMKKMEEELRELRKKLEATEQELAARTAELAQTQARHDEMRQELTRLHESLARSEKNLNERINQQSTHWEDEKSRLLFMLEERDNALSEAREGQSAATREIVSVTQELENNQQRLALLEVEAVKKGVPVVKVGYEVVVGEKAARVVAEKQLHKEENTPAPKASRRKSALPDFDPISAVVGFSTANMFELSDDARYTEKVNLDVESIPEPNNQPVKEKARAARKAPAEVKVAQAPKTEKAARTVKTAEKTEKTAAKPAKAASKPGKSVEKPAQPAEKPAQPAEKPAQPAEKPAQPAEKPAQPAEKPAQPVEKPAQPVEKPAQPVEKPAQNAGRAPQNPQKAPQNAGRAPQNPQRAPQNAGRAPQNPQKAPQNAGRAPQNPQKAPQNAGRAPQNPQKAPANPQKAPANPQKAPQNAGRPAQPTDKPAQPGGNSRSRRPRSHRRPRHTPGGSPA